MKTYAAIYNNKMRMESSSGGVFTLLAMEVIKNNGVVYGVAMTDDCYSAEFRRVIDIQGLSALRGSKYFQAKLNNTYKLVKDDIVRGKNVLFSGTPCQINGLKLYLGKEYNTLICLDVICHGVPSPALWKRYILHQERICGKIQYINFRCKDDSWQNYGIKENQLYIPMQKDSFMRMFLRDYCLRPSCYKCKVKQNKKSDITIADFWGIDDIAPEMNDNKGTSLVIIRTDKGISIFNSIKKDLRYKEVSYAESLRKNPSEYKSVKRPDQRETFFVDMNTMNFSELEKKYANDRKNDLRTRVKNKIKFFLKNKNFR